MVRVTDELWVSCFPTRTAPRAVSMEAPRPVRLPRLWHPTDGEPGIERVGGLDGGGDEVALFGGEPQSSGGEVHLRLEVPAGEQVRGHTGAVVPPAFVHGELEVGKAIPSISPLPAPPPLLRHRSRGRRRTGSGGRDGTSAALCRP